MIPNNTPLTAGPRVQTINGTFVFVVPSQAAGVPLYLSYADASNNLGPLTPLATMADLQTLQTALQSQIAALQTALSTKVDVSNLVVIDNHVRDVVADMATSGPNSLNTELNAKVNASSWDALVLASVNALVTTGPANPSADACCFDLDQCHERPRAR